MKYGLTGIYESEKEMWIKPDSKFTLKPKYSVAMIHLNMVETVAESVTSIVEQLSEEFEVVIVDDGSTDGSIEILKELSNSYPQVRLVEGNNSNHGEARQHAIREARGEYIIGDIDADVTYTSGIMEFVDIYEQIESVKEDPFLLLGSGIYVAPKALLERIPYRSMGYGEDRDLYRRLLAEDSYLSLSHNPIGFPVGYFPDRVEWLSNSFDTIVNQFRSGLDFWSYLRWAIEEMIGIRSRLTRFRGLLQVCAAPLAYLYSYRFERYPGPEIYRDIGVYKDDLEDNNMTLKQIENTFDVEIDRDKLGPRGIALYDIETTSQRLD